MVWQSATKKNQQRQKPLQLLPYAVQNLIIVSICVSAYAIAETVNFRFLMIECVWGAFFMGDVFVDLLYPNVSLLIHTKNFLR
ncbi:hypothetical protein AMR72_17955 [Flavobacterium psychrophilum]|nr:hypothetical protein AMR72_17955 [Flavobacterium psychrophilum]AOE54217.1 hypothetical protein ALW18_17940 [Flavobacterium psychrophilum]